MQGKSRIAGRTKLAILLIVIGIPFLIFLGKWVFDDRSYYLISLGIIVLAMIPFLLVFEGRRPKTREIMVIAVMASLAVVGRAAFFMLPHFKPMSAIIMIAGITLGAEAGFLTGVASAFVSNFFFGQGPWTPWQMFAFGMIGLVSGLLFYRKDGKEAEDRLVVCIYGGIVTLLFYGLLMDTASLLMYSEEITWQALLAMYASGLPFNLLHAFSTMVFLFVLYPVMEKKLRRVRVKYGFLQ